MTRVLIAEDDSLLRELLDAILRPHFPDLTLVANGLQAIAHLQENLVDVLVTDWMMPELDGIELIRRIRAESAEPPFIIMNTVLGSPEARAHALRSGADDFLAKPSRPAEMLASIQLAARRRDSSRRLPKARPLIFPAPTVKSNDSPRSHVVVAIAASTGGPDALAQLFGDAHLPTHCVYLVALHGPEWLHQSVVESLRRTSKLTFALAEAGVSAAPGTVYFAFRDRHLGIEPDSRLRFDATPPEHFLRPAADPLFRSVARSFGRHVVAVVLTGMGHDGAAGAAEVAAAGGIVLVQDPKTAVIASMPNAAIQTGVAKEVISLSSLGQAIARHTEALSRALASRSAAKQTATGA